MLLMSSLLIYYIGMKNSLKISLNWFSTQTKTDFLHLLSTLCQKVFKFFKAISSIDKWQFFVREWLAFLRFCVFSEVHDDVPKCRPDARTTRSSRPRRRRWSVHGHGPANRQNIQVSQPYRIHPFEEKTKHFLSSTTI